MRILAVLALAAGLAGASCNKRDLKAAGAPCNATSECQEGLTCDFGQDPPTCAAGQSGDGDGDADAAPTDGTPQPADAAPPDAGIDAS